MGDTDRAGEAGLPNLIEEMLAVRLAQGGILPDDAAAVRLLLAEIKRLRALASSRPAAPDSLDVERLATAMRKSPTLRRFMVGSTPVYDVIANEVLAALPSEARSDG